MNKKLRYLPYVFFIALLPAMIFRDFSPANELRYLSIADEAIRQGHIFAFTNHGELYADKPPLYLWIIMLGKMIFGKHQMWFLSLFSFVPAIGILRVMDRWVQDIFPPKVRLTSCIMLMSCGMFLCLSVFLRMDMLMCMFITLALYSFWQTYTSADTASKVGISFPVFIFLAIFTKGPIGILVPLISTIAFLVAKRQTAMIRRFWGWRTWSVLLAGWATWFFIAWMEGGGAYLYNMLFHQTLGRAVNAFHHKEAIYYYLLAYWYLLAPWSVLIVCVYASAFKQKIRMNDAERFFLTVIITTVVMLSLISAKLGVYLLPTFPFFVYLAVSLMLRVKANVWIRLSVALPSLIFTSVPVALMIAAHNQWTFGANIFCCAVAATSLSVSGIYTLWLMDRGGGLNRQVNSLACGIFVAFFATGLAIPSVNSQLGYEAMCTEAKTLSAAKHLPHYYTYGIYRPENMDVYLGKNVTEVDAQDILSGKCNNGILMIKAKKLKRDVRLQHFANSNKCQQVGENVVIAK
jgi:4-amino-4-deoxy-L-arabinose transferase-like glycosyltransferase